MVLSFDVFILNIYKLTYEFHKLTYISLELCKREINLLVYVSIIIIECAYLKATEHVMLNLLSDWTSSFWSIVFFSSDELLIPVWGLNAPYWSSFFVFLFSYAEIKIFFFVNKLSKENCQCECLVVYLNVLRIIRYWITTDNSQRVSIKKRWSKKNPNIHYSVKKMVMKLTPRCQLELNLWVAVSLTHTLHFLLSIFTLLCVHPTCTLSRFGWVWKKSYADFDI